LISARHFHLVGLNQHGEVVVRRKFSSSGDVKGVQLAITDKAESFDHLIKPEDAIRIAMARQ
jgi:hypothetical protein